MAAARERGEGREGAPLMNAQNRYFTMAGGGRLNQPTLLGAIRGMGCTALCLGKLKPADLAFRLGQQMGGLVHFVPKQVPAQSSLPHIDCTHAFWE